MENKPTAGAVMLALDKYADMVKRICFMYLSNKQDAEDAFQDVFLRLMQYNEPFESEEHEKAWICKVAVNRCNDTGRYFIRRRTCSLEENEIAFEDKTETDVISAVLSLPQGLKYAIYLFYYERYTVPEIAKILGKKENTVYSHLHRAKKMLKQKLEGYEYENLF